MTPYLGIPGEFKTHELLLIGRVFLCVIGSAIVALKILPPQVWVAAALTDHPSLPKIPTKEGRTSSHLLLR